MLNKKLIMIAGIINICMVMPVLAFFHHQPPPPAVIVVQPYKPKVVHYSYSATIYSGSLRQNIERIIADSHWSQRIIWDVKDRSGYPVDYRWVGTTRIHSGDVQGVVGKILANYPLQAVFYKGNRIVVIQPRVIG